MFLAIAVLAVVPGALAQSAGPAPREARWAEPNTLLHLDAVVNAAGGELHRSETTCPVTEPACSPLHGEQTLRGVGALFGLALTLDQHIARPLRVRARYQLERVMYPSGPSDAFDRLTIVTRGHRLGLHAGAVVYRLEGEGSGRLKVGRTIREGQHSKWAEYDGPVPVQLTLEALVGHTSHWFEPAWLLMPDGNYDDAEITENASAYRPSIDAGIRVSRWKATRVCGRAPDRSGIGPDLGGCGAGAQGWSGTLIGRYDLSSGNLGFDLEFVSPYLRSRMARAGIALVGYLGLEPAGDGAQLTLDLTDSGASVSENHRRWLGGLYGGFGLRTSFIGLAR